MRARAASPSRVGQSATGACSAIGKPVQQREHDVIAGAGATDPSGATLLALDTGGPTASVAIFRGQVLAEIVWQGGRRESAQLLTVVDMALHLARVNKEELAAVAVATGPGSYSGLRVGLATATGLALGLGIGIAQVPSLDSLAWGAAVGDRPVRAAVPLGRGRYASARFHQEEEDVAGDTEIEAEGIRDLAEKAAGEGATLVADLDPAMRRQLEVEFGNRLQLAALGASGQRAGILADLAERRLRRGQISPGMSIEPIYIGGAGMAP